MYDIVFTDNTVPYTEIFVKISILFFNYSKINTYNLKVRGQSSQKHKRHISLREFGKDCSWLLIATKQESTALTT